MDQSLNTMDDSERPRTAKWERKAAAYPLMESSWTGVASTAAAPPLRREFMALMYLAPLHAAMGSFRGSTGVVGPDSGGSSGCSGVMAPARGGQKAWSLFIGLEEKCVQMNLFGKDFNFFVAIDR